jgi:hypothetical protein
MLQLMDERDRVVENMDIYEAEWRYWAGRRRLLWMLRQKRRAVTTLLAAPPGRARQLELFRASPGGAP